ncbi:MAG: FAD-dependent oxidoreductase [Woeseiaceae bacterium]
MTKLVIIGTGLAGYTLAREFRRRDENAEILMITRDDGSSYSKPMLSNALNKEKTPDQLVMATAEKMQENLNATIWCNSTVTNIDTVAQNINVFQQGKSETLTYDQLVFANGANTISAPIQGDASSRVLSVNDLEDYRQFRTELDKGKRIVIIGAGMIGCEFANDLSNIDIKVNVVDLSSQALGLLLPKEASIVLQEKLSELGVQWHFENSVTHVDNDGNSLSVTLKDGAKLSADIVLSAIGLRPSIELAKAAGIETERGIKVDRYLQTNHNNIYALGDCAQVDDLTLPFVMPLMNSARALAATLADEATKVKYPAMPVALKTPCYPIVVCPAPRREEGEWELDINETGIKGLFKDKKGCLLGFILTGERVTEKTSLAKELPDWLA